MILVNVLLFVAVASGIVMLMISAEDGALQRSTRLSDAAQARAAVIGGEYLAITALRRDAALAAASDNLTEPWAKLSEHGAPIRGGTFDFAISDAQARFNVNAVVGGDADAVTMLGRIGAAAGLSRDQVVRAVEMLRLAGPVSDLGPLAEAGLSRRQIDQLTALVTALPYETGVNVNTASETLLALLLDNPKAAHRLAEIRERRGYLLASDFGGEVPALPRIARFTSDLYWIHVRADIGSSSQQRTSLIVRKRIGDEATQAIDTVVVSRQRGSGAL